MKCEAHKGKGRAPSDCEDCKALAGVVKEFYITKKCSEHSGRGRMPIDCPECARLNGLEVQVSEPYPIPKVDDNVAQFRIGDVVIRPLFNLYKTWENQIRYAHKAKVLKIQDDMLTVAYRDGNTFDVDSALVVKVVK
jgi:hypothetical protein